MIQSWLHTGNDGEALAVKKSPNSSTTPLVVPETP